MAILSPDFRSSTFSLSRLKSFVDFCVVTFEKPKIVDFARDLTVGRKHTPRDHNPEIHVTMSFNSRKWETWPSMFIFHQLKFQMIILLDWKYQEKHGSFSSKENNLTTWNVSFSIGNLNFTSTLSLKQVHH